MHINFDQCFYDEGIWRLDPSDEPKIDGDNECPTPLTEWVEKEFMGYEVCPYCRMALKTSSYINEEDGPCEIIRGDEPDVAQLWTCPYCAYWQWYSIFENRGLHGNAAMSTLSAFDPVVPEGCWTELAQHLRRNESLWHSISPSGMERLVAELFRSNYGHAEVIHVGKPADLGVDVVFVESGGNRWLIQVKRREKAGAVEGFETLQKLLGTLVLEGQFRGVIASNASHFSYQARREAARALKRGFTIEFLDRGKLNRMLGPLLPDQPWRAFVEGAHFPGEIEQRFINTPSARRRDQLLLFCES